MAIAMVTEALSGLFAGAGYNSAVVAFGATTLGLAAGGAGAFIYLRRRAMVSDAVSHATLPGICLAFLLMVALGADGRWLPGLLLGSAVTAAIGLYLVNRITESTRLHEDAAIAAVLSVFFGFGIVLLTVIQSLPTGGQAGLSSFLLGSTAGMLFSEALTIAIAGLIAAILVFVLRRPMTLVAFDRDYAETSGYPVSRIDLGMMALALIVTVVGLKIVGLVLIVALLITPPVSARFWTDRLDHLVLLSAIFGGISGLVGAVASALGPALPTGPLVVLVAFAIFTTSLLFSPRRGVLASALRHWAFQRRVHLRQGLLAMVRGERIYDPLTLHVLRRAGYIRRDGVVTIPGREAAATATRDDARWTELRRRHRDDPALMANDGLVAADRLVTADELADIDSAIDAARQVP